MESPLTSLPSYPFDAIRMEGGKAKDYVASIMKGFQTIRRTNIQIGTNPYMMPFFVLVRYELLFLNHENKSNKAAFSVYKEKSENKHIKKKLKLILDIEQHEKEGSFLTSTLQRLI